MKQKNRKYYIWFWFFLLLGLMGVFDIATRSIVKSSYGLNDVGFASFVLIDIFNASFGARAASTIATLSSIIFGFALFWFILAWIMRNKIKKYKNYTMEPAVDVKKTYTRNIETNNLNKDVQVKGGINNLDKAVKISIIIGILIVALSVFYYLIIFLPEKEEKMMKKPQQSQSLDELKIEGMKITIEKMKKLIDEGKRDEALRIINNMTDDEFELYKLIKDKYFQ